MLRASVVLSLLLLLFAPPLGAQAPDTLPGGVLFQTQGDVEVPAGTEHRLVVVFRGDLTVAGRVHTAIIVNGSAHFTATEVEEIVAVNSDVQLSDGAVVRRDVQLVDAELETDASSQVLGNIERGARHQIFRGFWAFGTLVAIGYAIAMVLGSMLAAGIAPHGVRVAGRAISDEPMKVLLWTLITWVLLPLGAMAVIPTIIGLPIGVGLFVFVLPTLAFLGYLVSAIRLGDFAIGKWGKRVEHPRPLKAAALGTVVLLLLGMAPVLGGAVPMIAGGLGSGAILLTLARGVGIKGDVEVPPTYMT